MSSYQSFNCPVVMFNAPYGPSCGKKMEETVPPVQEALQALSDSTISSVVSNSLSSYDQGGSIVLSTCIYNGLHPDVKQSSSTEQKEQEDPPQHKDDPSSEAPIAQGTNGVEPVINLHINNVVCSFNVRCHLDLKLIGLNGQNVEYRREQNRVTLKLRKPHVTASLWSSGKIVCTGAQSEDSAKVAARRIARVLQKMGFRVKFRNFRIVNVLGSCFFPFAIKLNGFCMKHKDASYEPELHPGVTYRIKKSRATLKIFFTGSVTVTAPSVDAVRSAIEYIYPLVAEFQMKREECPDADSAVQEEIMKQSEDLPEF